MLAATAWKSSRLFSHGPSRTFPGEVHGAALFSLVGSVVSETGMGYGQGDEAGSEEVVAEDDMTGYAYGQQMYAAGYDPNFDPTIYAEGYYGYRDGDVEGGEEDAIGEPIDYGYHQPGDHGYGDPSQGLPSQPARPKPARRAPQPKQPSQSANQLRKNSVKAACRPVIADEEVLCQPINVYGEWEGSAGRYRLPVRKVEIDEAAYTMRSVGEELKHLLDCAMIQKLFPEPGNLKCRQCGTVFSTAFNAASHGICRSNHFRCAPCGKAVTTLAAIQKHFKTPRHRQTIDGWTVDGDLKSTDALEKMHDGKLLVCFCTRLISVD